MADVFIVSAVRTPIGKFQGALEKFSAPQLGAVAVREAVKRAAIPADDVDEVFMGCVLQAGLGQNPARQAAIHGGIPPRAGAVTVNKVCGSGMKSILFAAQAVALGDAKACVAGGMESMSNAPYLLPDARRGSRLGHSKLVDAMIHDGLWDGYNDFHMGLTCELVAEKHKVSRADMDAFAVDSHRKSVAAMKAGRFKKEIVAVEVKGAKGESKLVDADEGPREDSSAEGLAKLKPAFKPDGVITAGNSSTINDGAAAVVVMSGDEVQRRGLKPLARITGYAVGGLEPKWVMMTPVPAVQNWERKTGLKRGDMDLVELNEAFACQSVAVIRELGLDGAKVNVNGGAVALGHPIGCSGARIVVTLLHALADRKLKRGLATLCMGGGNGLAMSVEMA
jgi:acetyl-CoA C-acetyltransferase